MKNFRTYELAVLFYKRASRVAVPKHLREQLDRAAASIALNLAEGNAKFSYRDKSRFFQVAYGSLRECQAIFALVELKDEELDTLAKHLGSSLYRLIVAVNEKAKAKPPSLTQSLKHSLKNS